MGVSNQSNQESHSNHFCTADCPRCNVTRVVAAGTGWGEKSVSPEITELRKVTEDFKNLVVSLSGIVNKVDAPATVDDKERVYSNYKSEALRREEKLKKQRGGVEAL